LFTSEAIPACSWSSAMWGKLVMGTRGHRSIAPVPNSPARVLGDHPIGACFMVVFTTQNGPRSADTQLFCIPRLFCPPGNGRLSKAKSAQKLEPQIEFLVGAFSHGELAKHLDFTVHRSCANIPRTPLRTCHQLLVLPYPIGPAQSLLTARESYDPHLLACAGWQSTPTWCPS